MSKVVKERDNGFKKLVGQLRSANGMSVRVGYFDKQHQGKGGASGITVADLARIHSEGASTAGIRRSRSAVRATRERVTAAQNFARFASNVAAQHALGAPHRGIPRRDWIHPVIDGEAELLNRHRMRMTREILDGTRTTESAVFEYGQIVAGRFVMSLKRLKHPPLKPATIAAKGSSALLRDGGFLMNSTEARVYSHGTRVK